ncbi:pre-rRNA processing protein, partial [Spiromyces aspiralis]
IHESPELRSYICTGIQRLVRSIHRLATAVTDDESTRNSEEVMTQEQAQGALHHLSQFTTNFLLVLFNVFSQTASPSRGYLFDTIQELLLITPQDDVSNAFERVHGMLVAALSEHVPPTPAQQTRQYIESNPPSAAHTMLDLAIAMVLSINRKLTDEFLKTIIPLIGQNEDPTLQKKAYKALYKLCGAGTTDTSRDSIHAALLPTLLPALIDATDVTAAGSRRERLALLALLVKHSLPASELHVIPTLLSEAIISTKEVNEKARTAAFDMLLALGHKMCKGGIVDTSKMTDAGADAEGEAKSASLEEYFKMVFAGLAAKTPHMVSATISALARLMFEFHSQLRPEFIAEILDTTLLFVDTNSREIAKSALGFVKVAVVALPPPILEQSLPKAVPCILKWSNEHKNRLKLNARHIIERLIRKFGLDAVDRVTPEEHKKLIGNIRKRKLRAANNKAAKGSKANGGEGEEKEAVEMAGLPAGKKNKYGNAYEDALYGSESDLDSSDSDEDYSSGEEGGKRGKTGKRGNKKSGKQAQEDPWIHESGDGPLDFLDRKAFVHMSTTKPKSKKERSLTKEFKVKDGRLVIEDEAESGDEKDKAQEPDRTKKQAVGRGEAEDYYRQMVESKEGFTRGQGNKIKFAKRKPGHDNDDDGDDAMEIENDSGRPSPKKAKKQKDRAGALGKEYRSKNAAGDMQKKGKVEPFAYIPLNPKLLGKRNSQNLGVKGNSKRGKRKAHHA